MQKKPLHKVLAVCHEKDSGIPITQIKVLTTRNKHPIIERMDFYGKNLVDKWVNSVVSRSSPSSIVFAETLGRVIDKVGYKLVVTNNGRGVKKMTEACFFWVWLKMEIPQNVSKEERERTITRLRWALWPSTGGTPEIREVAQIMSQTPL